MSFSMKSNNSSKTALSASDILDKIYPVNSIYLTYDKNNPSNFLGGTWEQFGQGRTLIGEGRTTDDNALSKDFVENDTGGEYYHTLSANELPSHNHSINISSTTGSNNQGHTHNYTRAISVQGHILTDREIPKHAHTSPIGPASEEAHGYTLATGGGFYDRAIVTGRLCRTSDYGGSESHNHGLNIIADTSTGESQNHTHTFSYSGNTGSTGNDVNSHNNMQPYIVIYFWRRTK